MRCHRGVHVFRTVSQGPQRMWNLSYLYVDRPSPGEFPPPPRSSEVLKRLEIYSESKILSTF